MGKGGDGDKANAKQNVPFLILSEQYEFFQSWPEAPI